MTDNRHLLPADKLLSVLDENPDFLEHYSTAEIERLPADVAAGRLVELGVDATLPPWLDATAHPGPAERLLSALDAIEIGEPADLENRPLSDVTTALNRLGVNHVAGYARLEELLGTEECQTTASRVAAPLARVSPGAGQGRRPRWHAVAAAAAIVCLVSTSLVTSDWNYIRSTKMWADISAVTHQLTVGQETQAQKIAGLQAQVAALEHQLADSKSALYSKLLNDKVTVVLPEVAMNEQIWKFSEEYRSRPATRDGRFLSLNVPLWDAGHVYAGAAHAAGAHTERTAMEAGWLIEKAGMDTGRTIEKFARESEVGNLSAAEQYEVSRFRPSFRGGLFSNELLASLTVQGAEDLDNINAATGAPVDSAIDVKRATLAAARINPSGTLGSFYVVGKDGSAHDNDGLQWLRRLASTNAPLAMVQLGRHYEMALDNDRKEAISWYRKAAANGSEEAKNALTRLGS